ncbi:MAG: hypothetical protein K0S22_1801 [Oscillospiraceae bacterium]|nr:hypothetical protein [Oscillospiraceae bacterium]
MPQCYPGSDLVLLAASLAITLSAELTASETNILAGLFTSIGDNLAIIAAKKELCQEAANTQ